MNAQSAGNKSTKVLKSSSNRGMLITVGALVVVAVLVLGGVVWYSKKSTQSDPVDFGATGDPQITFSSEGVITAGKAGAPIVQFWEDPMCPACGSFEKAYGDKITKAVNDGQIRAEYHLMNFLDRTSSTGKFSTRAIAALQCVAQKDSLKDFLAVKQEFFSNQPQEGGGDRTADEMATLASQAGASTDASNCIKNVESAGGLDKAADTANFSMQSIRKVNPQVSTPTVATNGEKIDIAKDPNWLETVINSAK